MLRFTLAKLLARGSAERVFRERLSEPLHLNFLAIFVALLGSYRSKVYFDLQFRQYTAFCLLDAADRAAKLGLRRISALEFGVAAGGGLLNICENARRVTQATGVEFDVYGFDTGSGLPPPRSYRDHPELYQSGDFVMDVAALQARMPSNAKLVIGNITETVPRFLGSTRSIAPIGYVSLDVDYYWSAADALRIFAGPPAMYLPLVSLYLDDCQEAYHNPACGELLACVEFNREHPSRQIFPYTGLRERRLFKNASWISKVCAVHILDHEIRAQGPKRAESKQMANPYLGRLPFRSSRQSG
jgi:hypothetical protein